jgi:hypothetical protein
MKIGVIFAIYNCEEYVDACLEPWLALREECNIILTATSGRFAPYKDLGIPDKNAGTIKKLATKGLDFIVTTAGDNLIDEDSSRNNCLNYLKPHNCDLIWIVDGDEIYTKGQIRGIIDFIERNPDTLSFSLYLKNYSIRLPYFETPWSRPSIYRNQSEWGRIQRFYFDTFFTYEDGVHGIKHVETKQVPKNVAFIEHYSWINKEYTHDKIRYQELRYSSWVDNDGVSHEVPLEGRCSKKSINGEVYFNEDYARIKGNEVPSLHEYPTDTILSSLCINYSRSKNRIELKTDYVFNGFNMIVKDLVNDTIYGNFEINISPDLIFWYAPGISKERMEDEDFQGFRVELFKEDRIVHIENILTQVGLI